MTHGISGHARRILVLFVCGTFIASPALAATVPDAGDEAFVRRVLPMMWGRHPLSSREVDVLVHVLKETNRTEFVQTLATAPEYRKRWAPFVRDLIAVYRIGDPTNTECYSSSAMESVGPELAAHVRDHTPGGQGFSQPWTMTDLIDSALQLDDLSPVFRANLFAHLRKDYRTADMGGARAARQARAKVFLRSQLNRRLQCMSCHNSEFSITGSPDPLLDRTWEIPGHYEKALFGSSGGRHVSSLRPFFRRKGVLAGFTYLGDGGDPEPDEEEYATGHTPWGMDESCGRFYLPGQVWDDDSDDLAFIVGELGSQASVWDLESLMAAGFTSLRDGLSIQPDLSVTGDQAMAWLLGMNFVDTVWNDVFGHRLTIANYFPRTESQRNTLDTLTQAFVANGYSLLAVLEAIATGEWFNRPSPASGAEEATPYPPVFDPWVNDDLPPAERFNGPSDTVARWPARVLLQKTYTALEWDPPKEFPQPFLSVDAILQRQVGVYLKDGDPGFRGISFQSLLAWESHFGACAKHKINPTHDDWIDRLVTTADADKSTVTYAHLVSAIKDRLLNDPDLSDPAERAVLAAVAGVSMDEAIGDPEDTTIRLRRVCGVFVATPQFMLGGWAPPDVLSPTQEPTVSCETNADCAQLQPDTNVVNETYVMPKTTYRTFCETLGAKLLGPCRVECRDTSLSVFPSDHVCVPLQCPEKMLEVDTNNDGWNDACKLDCPELTCEPTSHAKDEDNDGCFDSCVPGGGCAGLCGRFVVSSECQCDAGCFLTGDCCDDVCAVCGEQFAEKCGTIIESSAHYCQKSAGGCGDSGTCVAKPTTSCTADDSPVCGCDQKTYTNACMAAAAGINVGHQGACP